MTCREPAHWIAPYVGYPTYADVTALFARLGLRPMPLVHCESGHGISTGAGATVHADILEPSPACGRAA